jgi:hypothetical protein
MNSDTGSFMRAVGRVTTYLVFSIGLAIILLIGCASTKILKSETDIINAYRLEIAYAVQDNWKEPQFNSDVSNDLQSDIIFSVYPDGAFSNYYFAKRSGNELLDKAAMSAIKETTPFKPYPEGISVSKINVGLRFTPKGVK